MQAGKNTAASAKEMVANIGGSAKAGMDKSKATVQGQIEKMTAHNPVEKEIAQQRTDSKIRRAEINKQEARIEQAAQKEHTRVAGQPTGAGVTSGQVEAHPIGVNTGTETETAMGTATETGTATATGTGTETGTGTGTKTATGTTTGHNPLIDGNNPGAYGTAGGYT